MGPTLADAHAAADGRGSRSGNLGALAFQRWLKLPGAAAVAVAFTVAAGCLAPPTGTKPAGGLIVESFR